MASLPPPLTLTMLGIGLSLAAGGFAAGWGAARLLRCTVSTRATATTTGVPNTMNQ